MNVSNVYPDAYLNGNAMIIFNGHGSKDCIEFINGTYVYDDINNCPQNQRSSSIFISDPFFNLDYMAFAYLGGCKTAKDEDGLAYWMRCVKGVDNVLGFNGDIWVLQHKEFEERFFCYAISLGQTIKNSAWAAIQDVNNQFGGDYGGTQTFELWCRDNPGGGNEKIWYPRWGSPG